MAAASAELAIAADIAVEADALGTSVNPECASSDSSGNVPDSSSSSFLARLAAAVFANFAQGSFNAVVQGSSGKPSPAVVAKIGLSRRIRPDQDY